jgi:hypothetical protein
MLNVLAGTYINNSALKGVSGFVCHDVINDELEVLVACFEIYLSIWMK